MDCAEPNEIVPVTTNIADTLLFKYALSVAAALVAETVTYPLDLTKTRLQIQGEKSVKTGVGNHGNVVSQAHRGMMRTAVQIVKEEGTMRLWQGITPALYRHVVYSGCRMSCYEFIRDRVLGKNPDGTLSLWVRNAAHAFQSIYREGGVRGLWKGWVPNVQRAALVNMGDLATYDTAKHLVMKYTSLSDNYVTHTIASGLSGITAASIGTPADVIKTRIMNQPTKDGKGLLYRSSLDCLIKTTRDEGVLALYKGFIPIWARMAPWSLTFWLTYEQVRKTFGATSF